MNDAVNTSNSIEPNWLRGSKLAGFGLILGGLLCSIIAALWFTVDFIATSVMSPNLSADAQVSDFNDFGYIGASLSESHFAVGTLVLVMSIAVIVQGLLLLSREGHVGTLFLAGGIAFTAQVLFLMKVFYWPVFIVFLLTSVGLYLTTEWKRIHRKVAMNAQENTAQEEANYEHQQTIQTAETSQLEAGFDDGLTTYSEVDVPEIDAQLQQQNLDDVSALEIPTLVDEIATDDLNDDFTQQAFASEAAYLAGTEPAVDSYSEPEIQADAKQALDLSQAEPAEKVELPAFENELQQSRPFVNTPAPKKRIWNVFDWVISGLIVLVIIAIVLTIIAR